MNVTPLMIPPCMLAARTPGGLFLSQQGLDNALDRLLAVIGLSQLNRNVMARNIGPKSWQWLADIGITSIDQVRQLGAVEVYVRLKAVRPGVSLNMLWGLHAMLQDKHWMDVTPDEKELLKELVAAATPGDEASG